MNNTLADTLIIDDDQLVCHAIGDVAKALGHNVSYALTLNDGLKQALTKEFDIIFLDVRLPDGNGLNLLPKLRQSPSAPEVIIITGEGCPDGAELAIRSGAWDYVEKPLTVESVTLPLVRVLQYREGRIPHRATSALKRDGIVGRSSQIKSCLDLVAKAADSSITVLITGETGTGKELFAKAIHDNSARIGKPFVIVDCAALPENLIESILFGHRKGAFTGAEKSHQGLIKQADGGTLFLDEVGELPLIVQKKFLRVLENRSFRSVGGKEELRSDFRLISATNRDLDQMVKAGRFRKDLLYRLRSVSMTLPPLRARGKDIMDIAYHYGKVFCERRDIGIKGFSPDFMDMLISYSWPGNVRELVHAMENAISCARNESTLFCVHLPEQIRIELARKSVNGTSAPSSMEETPGTVNVRGTLREFLNEKKREYFQNLVAFTEGNMKEACRISGLSRSVFYDHLKKLQIRRPT